MTLKPYELSARLSKAIRDEQEAEELCALDDEFYSKMLLEIASLSAASEFIEDFREHTIKQLAVLFDLRLSKVIAGASYDKCPRDEMQVFADYGRFVRTYQTFRSLIMRGGTTSRPNRRIVIFNSPVGKFVDSAVWHIGPFDARDMAYIPEEDALILSRYGIVQFLEDKFPNENPKAA